MIKTYIEQDLSSGNYDESLIRYRVFLKPNRAALQEEVERLTQSSLLPQGKAGEEARHTAGRPINVLDEFERYVSNKGTTTEKSYYYYCKRMLQRWGNFDLENVPVLLANEELGTRAFNDRRNCLFKFFEWLERKKKIAENPLSEVKTKRKGKVSDRRKPFTDTEAAAFLEALRTNRFVKKNNVYPHAQYYPFVAFMLQTGVRNGEAVGLKVREINFEKGEIRIASSLARTRKGTNASARVFKGTKTDNERFIPMDEYTFNILAPLCAGKGPDDYVFVTHRGNPIDDKAFQRRVYKPVLKAIGFENKDLYTCRHTFATRAVKLGMKAHEVAYLMGDSVKTVLEKYFHNEQRPESLPIPVTLTAGRVAYLRPGSSSQAI